MSLIGRILREKWFVLVFVLFAWMSGSFLVHQQITKDKEKQLTQKLKLSSSMVLSQLQLLQLNLGQQLSEELSLSDLSKPESIFHSMSSKNFKALGLLKKKSNTLQLEHFFKSEEDAAIDYEFVQEKVRASFKDGVKAHLWVEQGSDRKNYLFSMMLYELEGNELGWGLGVSSLPSRWLQFDGATSVFLVDSATGEVISAYGGENQGSTEIFEEVGAGAPQVQISSTEAKAWRELPGTNLKVVVREFGTSSIFPLALWSTLILSFLLGILFLSGERVGNKIEVETEEDLSSLTQPPPLFVEKTEVSPKPFHQVDESVSAVEELPKEPPKKMLIKNPQIPIETVIEDQLIEKVVVPESGPQGNVVFAGVKESLESFQNEIDEKGIRVNILVPETLRSDWPGTQLRTVLEEVIKNSLEAMDSRDTKTLTFEAKEEVGFIHLTVEDTGVGMTDEVFARALEAFFSTKPSLNKRRGLGLNVVKRLLEISGGKLLLDSTPGVGTKATLIFPIHDLEAEDEISSEVNA